MTASTLPALPKPRPASRTGAGVQSPVSSNDGTIVTLFCLWVLLQSFRYDELPWLRWHVGLTITPDRLILFAMLLLYAKHFSRPGRPRTVWATTLWWSFVLFAIVGTTSWWVSDPDAGSTTFVALTRLTVLAFFPAISYFIASRLQYTAPMLRRVLLFFSAFGAYLSFTAICEHYQLDSLVFPKYILDPTVGIQFGRSRGPFVDTIGNGGMLLVSFLTLGCLSSSLTGLKRLLTLLLTLLIVPAVYFTETRAVWLGLGAAIITLFFLHTRVRGTAALIIGIVLIAFLAGMGSKFSLFDKSLFARRQDTVDQRFDNYQIAWNAFREHPVFGLGYGKLREEWSNYFDQSQARNRLGLGDGNHSTLLGLLAELGVAGTGPFVLLLACSGIVCIGTYRALNDGRSEFEREFMLVALGAVEAFLILGLTNDLRSQPTITVSTFWLVGMAASVRSARLASATPQIGRGRETRTEKSGRSVARGLQMGR